MDDQRIDREASQLESQESVGSMATDLIIAAGVLVLVMAIPLGLSFGVDFFWGDWYWATVFSVAMTLATAVVGGGLLAIGLFLWRRQKRLK
jgi:hypothetical protein